MASQQSAIRSVIWACTSSWYYGYHLSELNFPVASLQCDTYGSSKAGLAPCLGIDQHTYGLATAVYTVGGLVGSLLSSWVVSHVGVKRGITWTGWLNLMGAAAMAFAPHWAILSLGRFISGVSSGVAVCLVPPFLSTLCRASRQLVNKSGQIGTLHQLAIVIGLFTAQVAGMVFTGPKGDIPGNWRYIVAVSGIIAVLQIATESKIFDPASALTTKPLGQDGSLSPVVEVDEAGSPLLSDPPALPDPQLSIRQLISNPLFRGPTLLLASIMALQQLSGVNAVMFYSTPVLQPLMPSVAGAIGILITLINALMTVVAIFLVDRLGRKPLLLGSIIGMVATSAALAFGLNHHDQLLSAMAIILFIVAYAVGLGPIPFLLVSETVPAPGIPALASLSLSLSWTAAFFLAILFLPLRDYLSAPDDSGNRQGEGRVFYVFTATCILMGVLVWRGIGTRPARVN